MKLKEERKKVFYGAVEHALDIIYKLGLNIVMTDKEWEQLKVGNVDGLIANHFDFFEKVMYDKDFQKRNKITWELDVNLREGMEPQDLNLIQTDYGVERNEVCSYTFSGCSGEGGFKFLKHSGCESCTQKAEVLEFTPYFRFKP